MPNRLADEKSPYLLQHATIRWTGIRGATRRLRAARAEDKPIFLSVGYSTCHWCHVMEHESFEQAAVAEVLNQSFVSIKVDREERPDVDRVYMAFVQATTGAGGWPMSVWLTPELKPFYGGTYFPPESRYNRPGFVEVLQAVARAWRDERERIELSATELVRRMRESAVARPSGDAAEAPDVLASGRRVVRPGLRRAPRRLRQRAEVPAAQRAAVPAARACADAASRCLATWRCTRCARWRWAACAITSAAASIATRWTARGACRTSRRCCTTRRSWCWRISKPRRPRATASSRRSPRTRCSTSARELTASRRRLLLGGGCRQPAARSAAAGGHKVEGAFYVWSAGELRERAWRRRGGRRGAIRRRGRRQRAVRSAGRVHRQEPALHGAIGRRHRRDARDGRPSDVVDALGRARVVLVWRAADRPRPHLDDKVLSAWNGLMIAAFARGARVLRAPALRACENTAAAHLATAQRAAQFRSRRSCGIGGRQVLLRRFRDGDAARRRLRRRLRRHGVRPARAVPGRWRPGWLTWADQLQSILDARFYDPIDGGWFSTTGEDPTVLMRSKEDYDGAEPSPTALALLNLQVLTHLRPDAGRTARISAVHRAVRHAAGRVRARRAAGADGAGRRRGRDRAARARRGRRRGRDRRARCARRRRALSAVSRGGARLATSRAGTSRSRCRSSARWPPMDGQSAAYLCANFTARRR